MMLCSQCLSVPTSVIFTPLTILLSFLQFARFIHFILYSLCNHYIFLKQTSQGWKKTIILFDLLYSDVESLPIQLINRKWVIQTPCTPYCFICIQALMKWHEDHKRQYIWFSHVSLTKAGMWSRWGNRLVLYGTHNVGQCGLNIHGELME